MANNIKIYASDTSSNTEQGTFNNNTAIPGGFANNQARISWNNAKTVAAAGVFAKSMVNYGLSSVQTYTGDHVAQTMVNNTMQGMGLVAMSIANPYIAAAQIGFQITTTVLNENMRKKEENARLSIERARNGYVDSKSITTSGGH